MSRKDFTAYIDDMDIGLYGMKLVGYEIQSYAKRKIVGVDIPGAHGTQAVPSALASPDFFVNVVCVGSDPDDVNTKIREFFAFMYSSQNARKVVFSDDLNIVRYAVLDMPDKYRVTTGVDNAFAQLKLSFLMLDPFMYDSEKSRIVKKVSPDKKFSVENEAFECPAVFTFENAGQSAVTGIVLNVNGELATFSCQLLPGDVLVLDTDEYEVKFNDVVQLDFWRGEMPQLKNGTNVISQSNDQNSDLTISITFTKQWV